MCLLVDINGDALHASLGLPPALSVITAKVGKLQITVSQTHNSLIIWNYIVVATFSLLKVTFGLWLSNSVDLNRVRKDLISVCD